MQGQVMRKSHSTATQQEGHIADEWQGCPVAQTVSRREPLGRTCMLREAHSMGVQVDFKENMPGEVMGPVPASGLSSLPRHPDRS